MEKYYGQWYYEKKYYVCSTCNKYSLKSFNEFFTEHIGHLNRFKINKKKLLLKLLNNEATYSPPSKKIKINENRVDNIDCVFADEEEDDDCQIVDIEEDCRIVDEDDDCRIVDEEDEEDCKIVEQEDYRMMKEENKIVDEEDEEDCQIVDENQWIMDDDFQVVEEMDFDADQVGNGLDIVPQIESDLRNRHQIIKMDIGEWNSNKIILPTVLIEKLFTIINQLKNVKIQFGVIVEYIKEEETKTCRLSNRAVPFTNDFFEDGINKLNEKIENKCELGSNWKINKILEINFVVIKIVDINRLSGHKYIKSPPKLKNKMAIVNVKNNNDNCFLYSVLAILKRDEISEHNRNRPSQYDKFMTELKYNETDMPMRLVNITKFEQQNPSLAINVLTWNDSTLEDVDDDVMKHPNLDIIRKSKVVGGQKIYLLLLEDGVNFHYTAVMNLDRLMNRDEKETSIQIKSKWCPNCLNGFRKKESFTKHVPLCERIQTGTTQYTMPINTKLEFTEYQKTITPPFVIYADFESVLPSDDKYFQKHVPVSAGLLLVNNFTNETKYMQFIGDDCIYEFLEAIDNITNEIVTPYYNKEGKKEMIISRSQQISFDAAKICYLCKKSIKNKVRDHNHFTGEYIGPACNKCNLSRRLKIQLPVVFHNLKGYDLHHILKYGLSRFTHWNLSCIPTTTEKFLCLMAHVGNRTTIRFIDSLQFINSSLDAAVKTLVDTPLTKKEFNDDRIQMGKGIFPYNYATSLQVLVDTTEMPPRWENISESEYQKALEVWRIKNCNTLLDYMMVYLKLDVFLLADVFQQFRTKSLAHNKLEPLTFFGIPGMSWASALMSLNEPIELLSDNDMYTFFEGGIRGGLTFVNKHYVTSDDKTDLLYIDINNLYGWALSQKLPYGQFKWVYSGFEKILEDCKYEDLESLNYGYTMEVDMEIPLELHDYLSDLPVAAEHQCPPNSKVKKLLLTHYPKKHYVIHWRMLQMYIKLGVLVTNVHRAVRFKQGNIFKKYIDVNTKLRADCHSELEKNFYKLLNNSLYGKTVENLKKRLNLRLCNSSQKLITYASKAGFRRSIKIADDLIAVLMNKDVVCLDRPSYIGQSVLDLSKLRMYQLQYTELEKYRHEQNCQINIVAGDTDSFFLELKNITAENLTKLMIKDRLLDTSNYDRKHPLYSNSLNSVIGKFKDENKGGKYKEWVFLRPKCYSLLSNKTNMKAKGITIRNNELDHQAYLDCYQDEIPVSVEQMRFVSKNHQLYTVKNKKVGLTFSDDKRVWTGKNSSLPYGHYYLGQT